MKYFTFFTALTLSLVALPSASRAAEDASVKLALTKDSSGNIALDPAVGIGDKQAITLTTGKSQAIVLLCDPKKSIDCTRYEVKYFDASRPGGVELQVTSTAVATAAWSLPWTAIAKCQSGTLEVANKTGTTWTALIDVPVSVPTNDGCGATPSDAAVIPSASVSIQALLTTDCSAEINRVLQPITGNDLYDQKASIARFVVSAAGDVFARPPSIIDEGDTIEVTVVADERLLQRLHVQRASAIRTLGTLQIVGAGSTVPDFTRKSENQCSNETFKLQDFAPGRGQVTITATTDQGSSSSIGSFDFNVDTLYSGAFSLGPIYTTLKSPSFGAVANGNQKVVTETDQGSNRVLYMLVYTPYIWGRRDLEKESLQPALDWHRLNPMFGIVLNDVSNNAVVGLSYDISSMIYLDFGAHVGKVTRLDTNSGLSLGSAFSGTGAVPTTTQWKAGFFVGLTMDLRAATAFFGLASSKAPGN